jgi:hypothetical protein
MPWRARIEAGRTGNGRHSRRARAGLAPHTTPDNDRLDEPADMCTDPTFTRGDEISHTRLRFAEFSFAWSA